MINRYKYKKMTWVDLESPTQEEVREVMEEFDIHPLAANELLNTTARPKADLYPDFIYLILHFPAFKHRHGNETNQEVDFIIGKKFIITTHYETIDPLHEFSKVFEVNSIIDKSHLGTHAGFLFYYIAKELYKSLDHELEYIDEEMSYIEENIFAGNERAMVEELSRVNRNLLNFKQSIKLHEEILESLESAGKEFFSDKFAHYLRAITGEYHKIASQLEGHRETLTELRNTNDSLLSTKQNEIMKNLTIMAFVALPLSVLTGLFGMTTQYTPLVGVPGDFWIIFGLMVVAMVVMVWYFKHKGWI